MDAIAQYDAAYTEFMKHFSESLPDGIISVELKLLQKLELLGEESEKVPAQPLTRFFYVVESKEKITLYNDEFVIWITPEKVNEEPRTLVLIALNPPASKPRLELAYSTSGIYNTSRLVLRVLEKFLSEIQENEDIISHLEEVKPQ